LFFAAVLRDIEGAGSAHSVAHSGAEMTARTKVKNRCGLRDKNMSESKHRS
jgi:hypothetical protein